VRYNMYIAYAVKPHMQKKCKAAYEAERC